MRPGFTHTPAAPSATCLHVPQLAATGTPQRMRAGGACSSAHVRLPPSEQARRARTAQARACCRWWAPSARRRRARPGRTCWRRARPRRRRTRARRRRPRRPRPPRPARTRPRPPPARCSRPAWTWAPCRRAPGPTFARARARVRGSSHARGTLPRAGAALVDLTLGARALFSELQKQAHTCRGSGLRDLPCTRGKGQCPLVTPHGHVLCRAACSGAHVRCTCASDITSDMC